MRLAIALTGIGIAVATLLLALLPLYGLDGAVQGRIYIYKYVVVRVGVPVNSEVLSSAYTVFLLVVTTSLLGAGSLLYTTLSRGLDDDARHYIVTAVYGIYVESHMVLLAFLGTIREEVHRLLVPSVMRTTAGVIHLPATSVKPGPLTLYGRYLVFADFVLLALVIVSALCLARLSPRQTSSGTPPRSA